MHIRNMHLDDGRRYGTNGILQSYGSMRIGTGIQDNTIKIKAYFMQLVNHLALHIRLIILEFHFRITAFQLHEVILERTGAIDSRLPLAQQVNVGTIDNLYFHTSNQSKINIFVRLLGYKGKKKK